MSLRGDAARAALGTLVSRVAGLAREVVLAHTFGASGELDAFWIAFLVPNILRRLLGEGGVAIAFVPVYLREEGRGHGRAFLRASVSFAAIAFSLVCGLGVVLAPRYVPLLAAGFPPPRLALATGLSRTLFPFLAFVGFAALFSGLLNIRGSFFLPAVSPVLFSLGAIVGALVGATQGASVRALALGVLAGAFLQAVLLAAPLRGELGLGRPWHPGLAEVGRRLLPALAGLLLTEVNSLVDNRLASGLPAGSISELQYAMRLFQLPMGIVAASVGMAILPRLSRDAIWEDTTAFRRGLREGVEAVITWTLPAMAGLLVLGEPIIALLFGHGEFGEAAVHGTYAALAGYLVGLWGYALVRVFTRAFHALRMLRVPPAVLGIAAAVNIALDVALVGVWGVFGLALATGISGCVGGAVAAAWLRRRVRGWFPWRGTARALVGSGVMAAAVWAFDATVGAHLPELGRVAGGVSLGILAYAPFIGRRGWRSLLSSLAGRP